MRIAQVSPLFESVPPKRYGGTERIVSFLTEELVRRGHEVTLYASGDSQTRAELVPVVPRALRPDGEDSAAAVYNALQLELLLADAGRFDFIHFHTDHAHYPLARRLRTAHVTTLHGRLDLPELQPFYRAFRDVPLVSISHSQRQPLPLANWVATVYHGLPARRYRYYGQLGEYLVFLGRISPEKRLDRAIEIARRAGLRLLIAAKLDDKDRKYYEREIRALMNSPWVRYIGEINDAQKCELVGRARALLFPIDWPEPFGLVMIEAMACGTPVIAWRCGSVPEVVEDGVSGYIVDSMDEAVEAVYRARELDRRAVRGWFERRFSVERMTDDYLRVYRRLAMAQRRPASIVEGAYV
jgi:glycosyltransferase involved in cell wall biosynthesis